MDRAGRPGDDLVAGPEPINEQLGEDFHVGGRDREMPPADQLEQLRSYIDATYDPAAGQYLALLPDRITHAAMIMLGTAVDHTMPGVAFPGAVRASEVELGAVFTASSPGAVWCISLYDGPASAHDHSWRPEAAGLAELAGATVLDVDDVADAAAAVDYARSQGAAAVAVWAFGSAAAAVPAGADGYVFTFPVGGAEVAGAPVLVQVATQDEVADEFEVPAGAEVHEYHSTHYVATPAESRRRVRDAAEFVAGLGS